MIINNTQIRFRLQSTIVILVIVFISLSSCSMVRKPESSTLQIKGLLFKNFTDGALKNISLKVAANHKFISCGYIAIRGECSTTFPIKEYQGNSISLSWSQHNQQHLYDDIYIDQKSIINFIEPALVVITIYENSKPTAEFTQ